MASGETARAVTGDVMLARVRRVVRPASLPLSSAVASAVAVVLLPRRKCCVSDSTMLVM